MNLNKTTSTSTWSGGGVGGKSTGAVGGADGGGKLPVQPGSVTSTSTKTSADTFDTSTSTSTSINLTGT